MTDDELRQERRERYRAELEAALMGHGLDYAYARVMARDPATLDRLRLTDDGVPATPVADVARAVAAEADARWRTPPADPFHRDLREIATKYVAEANARGRAKPNPLRRADP